jgi:UTP--glucose-1-phosphate uridylyltransferase
MGLSKAVIPVAGLGTRFLPASKGTPKELFPILNKPLLLYIVEEIVASGIEEIILVNHPEKKGIERFFAPLEYLEKELAAKGQEEPLENVRALSKLAEFRTVFQKEPKGLGHAVLCAREAVGDEMFAVVLPDDLIDNPTSCLQQMRPQADQTGLGVAAVMPVPSEKSSDYGMIGFSAQEGPLLKISSVVEKPDPKNAPSPYAIVGRYILPASTFEVLANLLPGKLGEIQLTDAIDHLAQSEGFWAYEFKGERYDAGDTLGFVMANIHYGLKDPKFEKPLKEFLQKKLAS